MNDLKLLSHTDLIQSTDHAVAHEREATTIVLEHLREMERRRLFARMGFSSLFAYCTQHLKYCPASAQLRIDAMRLSKELPEVTQKLEEGTLTLSTLGSFQKFIRHERSQNKTYSQDAKRELLKQVEGRSKQESEKFFTGISPQAFPEERTRVVSPTQTELKLVADENLMKLIEQMRSKLRQKGNADPSLAEIFEASIKKALGIKEAKKQRTVTSPGEVKKPSRPYIQKEKRRRLDTETGKQCTYHSPITGQRCQETRFLQTEHLEPFALGGSSELENLTLLCATHNRLKAVDCFGERWMLKTRS